MDKDRQIPIDAAELALLASVFVIAACGLVYELVAGTLASYLLGDSVLQFSTIIGTYLFAMGIGSWLSRYITRQLPAQFLRIELLVGLIGGLLPAALFLVSAHSPAPFRGLLYGLVWAVGVLVGLEIPLVMRLLKQRYQLKDLVSQVLTFDYLGALGVSIAFPIWFVPQLGLIRTGAVFGLMNTAVAGWALWLYRGELLYRGAHLVAVILTALALFAALIGADGITRWSEDRFYADRVIYAESSPYQRIVVTGHGAREDSLRLFLNGNLQFHARDEYRYHEALVHPAMAGHGQPKRVLILGGGDGMAAREVLRYDSVQSITLVDLDPHITDLFRETPVLRRLNRDSLHSPKLQVINEDAFQWLQRRLQPGSTAEPFDVVIIDFPDPSNYSLGKLYTTSFYSLVDRNLAASGYLVVQTTSPLIARKSFWTVATTLESVGLRTVAYHAHVPSFGEWGFILAGHRPYRLPATLPPGLRFLSVPTLPLLFDFPPDMARVDTEPNRPSNQVLVQTFEAEWGQIEGDH